jgi:two-component system, LytTR family, response regulator
MPFPPNALRAIRVLIVDDEPPARRRLRSLLAGRADILVTGEAAHGGEAVQMIRTQQPDLVLLDVQLPVATGLEVVDEIGVENMPLVIFVTAYDEHAIRAFEVHAVDYLLKPVDPARLNEALERAAARLSERGSNRSGVRKALDDLRRPASARRIPVREGGRIRFVDLAAIDYAIAEGNYVRLRVGGANHLIRDTLTALEERFAQHGFLRIHRGILVQMDRIAELSPLFHGEYSIRLKDGTKLVSGRTYRERIRQALSLDD